MSIERPGGKGGFFIYNLNPRVAVPCFCGGPQGRPCKKQTAFLLRLANFPGGRRSALVKIGALRQRRLPVSSTGRGRRRCPCSALLHRPQDALRLRSPPPIDVTLSLRLFPHPATLPNLSGQRLCGCCAACKQREKFSAQSPLSRGGGAAAGLPLEGGWVGKDNPTGRAAKLMAPYRRAA